MTQPTSSESSTGFTIPVVLTVVASASIALAPLVGVISGGDAGGPVVGAAITSAAVWGAIAAVAVLALVRGRTQFAGSFVAAVGAMSLGFVLADGQLFVDAIDADRLELFRPVSAAALSPGLGAIAVLAGHVVMIVAGVLATSAVGRSVEPGEDGVVGRRVPGLVVLAGVLGSFALAASFVVPSYSSTDPVFLAPALVGAPALLAIGGTVSAIAALVLCAVALSSTATAVAVGTLVGAALGTVSVASVRLVGASGAGDRIDVSAGSVLGVVGAAVVLAAAVAAGRSTTGPDRRAPRVPRVSAGSARRHVIAGVLVVVAGVALGTSSLLPLLEVPTRLGSPPDVAGQRSVLVFALVTVAAGALLFFSEFASTIRPAAVLIVVGHLALAAAVLQAVVLGVGIDDVSLGSGAWTLVVGVVIGAVALGALGAAGAAERDGIDTSDLPLLSRGLGYGLGAAAVVSAVGLALPPYDIDGEAAGWIGSVPWGWDVWGRLVLASSVAVAALVASRARRARAVALEVGAAIAVAAVAMSAVVGGSGAVITPSVGAVVSGVGAVATALVAGLLFRTGE